jgi:DNA-binding transcriptional ArsR family regulator
MPDERIPDRTIDLADPRAMRAYAHPVRLALIHLLRTRGPVTATQAAAALGESSGTCSFHLRQLARYGIVEEAGGGRGREKPWRATAAFTDVGAVQEEPARREAQRHFEATMAQRYFGLVTRWLAERDGDPPEWRSAAGYGDLTVPLTVDELVEVRRGAEAFLERYRARMTGAEPAPEGARPVTLVLFGFPDPEVG